MKEIPLTKGMVALVDDDVWEWAKQYSWYAETGGDNQTTAYARRRIRENGKARYVYLHRVIMNAKPGQQVDHINNNGLDCRRVNLRLCTDAQNHYNKPKPNIITTSRFKGVCLEKRTGKWIAGGKHNWKRYNLGVYKTEEEAAAVYDKWAIEHFGEFALTNAMLGLL